MKNLIDYTYSINVLNIKEIHKNIYYLKTDSNAFLLCGTILSKNLDFVLNINNYLYYNFSYGFKLVKNVYNSYLSNFNNQIYILFCVNSSVKEELDFIDLISFQNSSKKLLNSNIKYKNNWENLWESKINYLMRFYDNNKIGKINLRELFWYYIGIFENALLYIKHLNKDTIKTENISDISIVHRRIFYPNYKINFFNPLNYLIDLSVRDIAEYIKISYYTDQDYLLDLDYYLKTSKVNFYNASMLFARIIYPSYFFDYYENESISFDYKKFYDTKNFELFIKKTYELINSYVKIKPIEWIINQSL